MNYHEGEECSVNHAMKQEDISVQGGRMASVRKGNKAKACINQVGAGKEERNISCQWGDDLQS